MSRTNEAYSALTPFRYLANRHTRTEQPPAFKDYRRYKPYLQREFSGRCVYCLRSDLDQDSGSFHVEHYRPKAPGLFPELEADYSNLYYACASCNRYKGRYWHEDLDHRLLNPCEFVMADHLRFAQDDIDGLTEQGQLNIDVLRLNNADSLNYRERQQKLIRLLLEQLIGLHGTDDPLKIDLADRAISLLAQLTGQPEHRIKAICEL